MYKYKEQVDLQENRHSESPRNIPQGRHWQSDKEPVGREFKKHYNQLSSNDRGSNKWVFQWTGVVIQLWQIAIRRWIVQRSIFGDAIACKSPSKLPTDPSDHQSASKRMIVSNHYFQ